MPTPPVQIAGSPWQSSWASASGARLAPTGTSTFTVSAGDLLVVLGVTEDNLRTLTAPTNVAGTSPAAITWSTGTGVATGSRCRAYVWTGAVTSSGNVQVSSTPSATSASGIIVWGFNSHGGVGLSASGTSTASAPSAGPSGGSWSPNSALCCANGDWTAGVHGPPRAYLSIGTTPVESNYTNISAYSTEAWLYPDVGSSPGTSPIGLSSPNQTWSLVGVEVLGTVAAATSPGLYGYGTYGSGDYGSNFGGDVGTPVSGAEALAFSEGASLLAITLLVNDAVVMTEVASSASSAAAADSVLTSEQASTISAALNAADSLLQSDSSSLLSTLSLAVNDDFVQSEGASALSATLAAIETHTLTDLSSLLQTNSIAAVDSWSLADSSALLQTVQKSATDSWSLNDVSNLATLLTLAAADSFSMAEASGILDTTFKTALESGAMDESLSITTALSTTDFWALFDSSSTSAQISTTDTQNQSEQSAIAAALSATDAGSYTESSSYLEISLKIAAEVFASAEQAGVDVSLTAIEAWALLEAVVLVYQTVLSDNQTQDDQVTLLTASFGRTDSQVIADLVEVISNSLSVSDSSSHTEASSDLSALLSLVDTSTLLEAVSIGTTISAFDAGTFTDVIFASGQELVVSASDSATQTEETPTIQTQNLINTSDSLVQVDVAAMAATLATLDTATLAEVLALNVSAARVDSWEATESSAIATSMFVNDSLTMAEARTLVLLLDRDDSGVVDDFSSLFTAVGSTDSLTFDETLELSASLAGADAHEFLEVFGLLVEQASHDDFLTAAAAMLVERAGEAPGIRLPSTAVLKFIVLSAALRQRSAEAALNSPQSSVTITPRVTGASVGAHQTSAALQSKLTNTEI